MGKFISFHQLEAINLDMNDLANLKVSLSVILATNGVLKFGPLQELALP